MICYFFYKNITFGVTVFLYEAYTSFSAQPAYNDWFLSLFNVFFSSLPVIALRVFDQDVSARFCYKFRCYTKKAFRTFSLAAKESLDGCSTVYTTALAIFFLCKESLKHQIYNPNGQPVGREILGGTMYTCIVWVVNLQMVLAVSYFTWIQHFVIWGSIAFWYIFLMIYGAITPSFSEDAYKVFIEALAPAPSYWLTTLFVMLFVILDPCTFYSVMICIELEKFQNALELLYNVYRFYVFYMLLTHQGVLEESHLQSLRSDRSVLTLSRTKQSQGAWLHITETQNALQ